MPPETAVEGTDNRIPGTILHPLCGLFGLPAAAVAYFLSRTEYTATNARNALNWHLFVIICVALAAGIAFGLGSFVEPFVILGAFLGVGVGILHLVFTVVATVKAARGTAWVYPLAPGIV